MLIYSPLLRYVAASVPRYAAYVANPIYRIVSLGSGCIAYLHDLNEIFVDESDVT